MYSVNYKKLIVWMIPHWLRKNVVLILAQACVWLIIQTYNAFIRFVDAKLYRVRHNSQVCYLRAVLNDAFDNLPRRILIDDFDGLERIYFWAEADQRDIDFSVTQYFWADNAYADSGVDFTVKLPTDIVTTDPEMKRLMANLNEYKLPGKNYNIVRI